MTQRRSVLQAMTALPVMLAPSLTAAAKKEAPKFIISGMDNQAQADQLQAALGVGEVVQTGDSSDSVDITVILGADALGETQLQGTSSTVSGG